MKLSAGTHFNLKRGEIKVFYAEVTLENDDTIRGLFNAPGKVECISVEGQNYLGEWFDKLDKIAKAGVPKKLWFYVKAPDAPGSYKGVIEIINTARKLLDRAVITYDVSEEIAEENQFKNPEELTRLFWINSKLGIDNEVTSPYTPVEFDGGVAKILGRELVFNSFALPEKITTHFDENGKICDESWEILSDKIAFSIGGESFKNVAFGKELFPDSIRLSSVNENDNFIIKISTRLEFDGHITTKLFIAAKRDAKLSDVNISLPISEYASKYFMGLGNKGGAFNKALDWKWDSAKNQDSFWVGNVNAGIRVKFYGENYEKPLTANHYSKKPLELPVAWNNGGRGGVRYEDGSFIIYSGERELKYSEKLSFNLDFTVTPIKPQAAEKGEYTLIKKGEAGNSLPNAPYGMGADFSLAKNGERAVLGFDMRELSEKAYEYAPMLDFDRELLLFKDGNASLSNPQSRITNFYVEELNYLIQNEGISGVYLDEVSFDRNTLKRVRKIVDTKEGGVIDLSFGDEFTEEAGFANSFLTYLEIMPFVDKIHLKGKACDENCDADYKLVALSGKPFGMNTH